MPEDVNNAAAPSSAAVEAPKLTQFDGWDSDGNPTVSKKDAAPPKTEAAAASDAPKAAAKSEEKSAKGESESASATEAEKNSQDPHQRRKPGAEARIGELAAKVKQLEKELNAARTAPKSTSAESSPAGEKEQPPAQLKPPERPKLENFKSYEEYDAARDKYIEELTDYKAKLAVQQAEQARIQREGQKVIQEQLTEAKKRYADFDDVAMPVVKELTSKDIHPAVRSLINASPVLPDLMYVLGGNKADLADFLATAKSDPIAAIRKTVLLESLVLQELAKAKAAPKAGAETEGKGPVEVKPRAPKPPSEVGGRGAVGEDALISAAKANDFRAFEAEQSRRVLASRR